MSEKETTTLVIVGGAVIVALYLVNRAASGISQGAQDVGDFIGLGIFAAIIAVIV